MRNLITVTAAAVAGILSVTACGSSPPALPAAPAKAAAAASPSPHASAISACYRRKPASGDIYVRTAIPGLAAQAQKLGGGWTWDYVAAQCLDSVQFTIRTAADGPGDCTKVGYVKDNPRYNANETPAPPLKNVAAVAGSGC